MEGGLRGRPLQRAAHVRSALRDGGDHQREPARRRVFPDVGPLCLALAVEPRVVEAAVHLRRHPLQRRLLEAGRQLLAPDLEKQVHQAADFPLSRRSLRAGCCT